MSRTVKIPVTTDAGGAATETRIGVHGDVLSVTFDSGDMTTGTVDCTVTDDLTGAAIASFTDQATATKAKRYPKVVPTQPNGTALTTAGPAVSPTLSGRVKVVIAQGGNVKSGTVYVNLAD